MNKINLSKKNIIIISIIIVVFALIIIGILSLLEQNYAQVVPNKEEQETSELLSHKVYDDDTDISLATLTSTTDDYSALLIKNGAIVTLRDSTVNKYEGFISDKTKLEEIGLNSVIVVSYDSELKVTNSKIESSVEYTNGIYVSGKKTKAYLIDSDINGFGVNTNGLVVATSAYAELEHSNITTKFKSSPAIVVKDLEGKVRLKNNVMLETGGNSSPLFKSSGNISVKDSTGTANSSRFAVLQGGSLNIKNSTLISAGANDNEKDNPSGFLINGKENTEIEIEGSSININSKMPYYYTAIMFDATNTKSTINLNNVQFNYGSKRFINLVNSNVSLNCTKQNIDGTFELDENSSININIKNNSSITGSINNQNKSNNAILTLDSTSKLILTEDTYLKELNNENKNNSNITYNNHKLYVNGNAIN